MSDENDTTKLETKLSKTFMKFCRQQMYARMFSWCGGGLRLMILKSLLKCNNNY